MPTCSCSKRFRYCLQLIHAIKNYNFKSWTFFLFKVYLQIKIYSLETIDCIFNILFNYNRSSRTNGVRCFCLYYSPRKTLSVFRFQSYRNIEQCRNYLLVQYVQSIGFRRSIKRHYSGNSGNQYFPYFDRDEFPTGAFWDEKELTVFICHGWN